MGKRDISEKVVVYYTGLVGPKATRLEASAVNKDLLARLQSILQDDFGDSAKDLAFHLGDWGQNAAFMTMLHLSPELLTDAEVKEGLEAFLLHAPNHIAAAAKLSGNAVQDVFEVGALDGIHQFD